MNVLVLLVKVEEPVENSGGIFIGCGVITCGVNGWTVRVGLKLGIFRLVLPVPLLLLNPDDEPEVIPEVEPETVPVVLVLKDPELRAELVLVFKTGVLSTLFKLIFPAPVPKVLDSVVWVELENELNFKLFALTFALVFKFALLFKFVFAFTFTLLLVLVLVVPPIRSETLGIVLTNPALTLLFILEAPLSTVKDEEEILEPLI